MCWVLFVEKYASNILRKVKQHLIFRKGKSTHTGYWQTKKTVNCNDPGCFCSRLNLNRLNNPWYCRSGMFG